VVAVSDPNVPDLKKKELYKLQKNVALNLVEQPFVCGKGMILCCVEGILEILFNVSYLIKK
jgi:hypothetical protein